MKKLNNSGIVLVTFATWLAVAFVAGSASGYKASGSKLTKDCVSNGGSQSDCEAQVKSMSFRNRMLALQK